MTHAGLRAVAVSRVADMDRALLVLFDRVPTNDDIRAIHDFLRSATLCRHDFQSNYGLYDTKHPYCTKCGMAEP